MDQFRLAAAAEPAGDVVEFPTVAQASEDGLDVGREKGVVGAGGEDGQGAGSGAGGAAGDGGVDEADVRPTQLVQTPFELIDIRGRDGRADDDGRVLLQSGHGAGDGVEKERAGLEVVRDHDEHEVDISGRFAWRVSRGAAFGDEPEHGGLVDVVADDWEAGAQEVSGHAVAHGAEAGEEEGGVGVGHVGRVVEG